MRSSLGILLLLSSAPAFAAKAYPAPPIAEQMAGLGAAEQVARLQAVAPLNPSAKELAAAAIVPERLESRQAEIAALVGPGGVAAFQEAALNLSHRAWGDPGLMEGLRSAAGAGGDFSFDGLRSGDEAALLPASVWPASDDPNWTRRVSLVSSAGNDRYLINGLAAQRFRARSSRGGVDRELLVHPQESGLLVRVSESPADLAAYRSNAERVAGLSALSRAGAAPRLVEYGEQAVPGKGLVYFYVQELFSGTLLAKIPRASWPQEAIETLIDKLARAGVTLELPANDPSALMSLIRITEFSHGPHAFLLGAKVDHPESGAAPDGYHAMLRDVLRALGAERPAAAAVKPAQTFSPLDSFDRALREAKDDAARDEIIVGLSEGVMAYMRGDELDRILMQVGKESDQRAASIYDRISPVVWKKLQLRSILTLAQSWTKRDFTITTTVVAQCWSRAHQQDFGAFCAVSSSDVRSLLALILGDGDAEARSIYESLPAEAWRKLKLRDLELLTSGEPGLRSIAMQRAKGLWREARGAGAPKSYPDLLKSLQVSAPEARPKKILELPGYVYADLTGPQIADVLVQLDWKLGIADPSVILDKIPEEAWYRMDIGEINKIKDAIFTQTNIWRLLASSNAKLVQAMKDKWIEAHE